MKRLLILLIATLPAVLCAQPSQVDVARNYRTTPVATNAWAPFSADASRGDNAPRVFNVFAVNSSAADTWLHLCDTNGLPANGTAAHIAPVKVTAGATGGYDFGVAGCPFTNGLCVVNSTTDRHITNGSANLVITVIYNQRPK